MAFLDDIGRRFSEVGQEAGQMVREKTGKMSDTSRLKGQIADEERRIEAQYAQLGRTYMALHRDNPEPEMAGTIQEIVRSENALLGYRQELQRVRGVRSCPRCGGEVSMSSAFCTFCGNPMPVEAPPTNAGMRFCSGCGAVLEEGTRFCTHCGRPAPVPEATPVTYPAAPSEPAAPAPEVKTDASAAPAPEPKPEAPAVPSEPASPAENWTTFVPNAAPAPAAAVYQPPITPEPAAPVQEESVSPTEVTAPAEANVKNDPVESLPVVTPVPEVQPFSAPETLGDPADGQVNAATPVADLQPTPAEPEAASPVIPEAPTAPMAEPSEAETIQPDLPEPLRFCPSCGAPIESGDVFCMNCGTRL